MSSLKAEHQKCGNLLEIKIANLILIPIHYLIILIYMYYNKDTQISITNIK